jgi:hypothetical protein
MTCGPSGCINYEKDADFEELPTFASRVRSLLNRLSYRIVFDNGFRVWTDGGHTFLQHWQRRDGNIEKGRKWVLSEHMVDSEILQTALLAVLTYEEHEAREALTFDGRRLYGPHRSLVNLDKEIEVRDKKEPQAQQPVEETGPRVYGRPASRAGAEADYPWLEQRRKSYDPYADDPLKF